MLHVITSLDLKKLADSLYDKLYQCWDNPFDSPTVIFPDAKTEQWFRFYVLKENKTNVLMNLNCDRLDSFLFKTLKDGDEQRLTVNILRDFLILKLSSKISENIFYFQTLDSPEVETYLQVENGINQNHLYDFAQQMAELFIEYENTRNKTFFNTLPKWQKKLYDDVTDININGVQYNSIPQLFNKNTYFNFNSKLPVYIFGFSGMGQIYRNILKDFAKQYDLYVFLQTTDTDAKNNALLKSWSKFGYENYTLWSNESENIISEKPKDSLLHKIQNYILTDKSNTERLSVDSSLSITAAPTKIREIECLHTKVCNLLKTDSVSLSDILVLAPDIQEYRVAINQIFDAVDSKNNQYPYIPYNIVDFSAKNSLTVVILETI
ncbi:MAG: exodeoxyribonuclease V subunit gamma, partial [Alphaproteobacteria bacterium]|nr:exodeoxyribonuclease V subunit gamma [Alphaproteobacteria bacterium]